MKKYILSIILLILLSNISLFGCNSNANDTLVNDNSQEGLVDNESKDVKYFMSGKIQGDESVDIASKITARVISMKVDIGSKVNKGDNLIELDSKSIKAQVAQFQAAVDVAQANLDKVKSNTRPEVIAKDTALLESAKINYEDTKTAYDRNKELFESGAITKAQLETSEIALATTQSAYKAAQAALDVDNNGETPETIAISEAALKKAQTDLAAQQVMLQDGVISAPISGVIIAKNIRDGELAAPGTPLLTIVNLDTAVVNAYVPSTYINKITLNQEVIIKVSEIPDKEFSGEISTIDSAIDSKSKNIFVKIKFKDKDPLLRPGMFAEIGIRE